MSSVFLKNLQKLNQASKYHNLVKVAASIASNQKKQNSTSFQKKADFLYDLNPLGINNNFNPFVGLRQQMTLPEFYPPPMNPNQIQSDIFDNATSYISKPPTNLNSIKSHKIPKWLLPNQDQLIDGRNRSRSPEDLTVRDVANSIESAMALKILVEELNKMNAAGRLEDQRESMHHLGVPLNIENPFFVDVYSRLENSKNNYLKNKLKDELVNPRFKNFAEAARYHFFPSWESFILPAAGSLAGYSAGAKLSGNRQFGGPAGSFAGVIAGVLLNQLLRSLLLSKNNDRRATVGLMSDY